MSQHDWQSCHENCRCRRHQEVVMPRIGAVIYKNDAKEDARVKQFLAGANGKPPAAVVEVNYGGNYKDIRDNRDPESIGLDLMTQRDLDKKAQAA